MSKVVVLILYSVGMLALMYGHSHSEENRGAKYKALQRIEEPSTRHCLIGQMAAQNLLLNSIMILCRVQSFSMSITSL